MKIREHGSSALPSQRQFRTWVPKATIRRGEVIRLLPTLLFSACLFAIATPAMSPNSTNRQHRLRIRSPTLHRPSRTSWKARSSSRPPSGSTVPDVPFSVDAQTQEDIRALMHKRLGPSRISRPHRPEPRAGKSQVAIRGVATAGRARPIRRQGQVGIYLDESSISFSVYAGFRSLRPEPRRASSRSAGTLFGAGSIGGRSATSPISRNSIRPRARSRGTSTISQAVASLWVEGCDRPARWEAPPRARIVATDPLRQAWNRSGRITRATSTTAIATAHACRSYRSRPRD